MSVEGRGTQALTSDEPRRIHGNPGPGKLSCDKHRSADNEPSSEILSNAHSGADAVPKSLARGVVMTAGEACALRTRRTAVAVGASEARESNHRRLHAAGESETARWWLTGRVEKTEESARGDQGESKASGRHDPRSRTLFLQLGNWLMRLAGKLTVAAESALPG
jgi:hypothetical protein